MNEFLKNLRSGKDRSHNSGRGNYDYYPHPDRRSGGDRRNGPQRKGQQQQNHSQQHTSRGSDAALGVVADTLPGIHNLLQSIADATQRIADARERRADAEERKVALLESLAGPLRDLLESEGAKEMFSGETRRPVPQNIGEVTPAPPKKIPPEERDRVVQLIRTMRKNGSTYDQIAGYLDQQQIPTFSNKGKWHAQTIHRLCQKK